MSEKISQTIGIFEGGPALKEVMLEIGKAVALDARDILGDMFHDIEDQGRANTTSLKIAGRNGYEAAVLYHASESLPEGDFVLAQAVCNGIHVYFETDFVIITPEGMAATTRAAHKNCGAIQCSPRDRKWTAHSRVGPSTTLRRIKDFNVWVTNRVSDSGWWLRNINSEYLMLVYRNIDAGKESNLWPVRGKLTLLCINTKIIGVWVFNGEVSKCVHTPSASYFEGS
jgi:hypothetical protein